jgi:hypothetical protein
MLLVSVTTTKGFTMTTPYLRTIAAVRAACATIRMSFESSRAAGGDGRVESSVKEGPYLEALKTALGTDHRVQISPPRYWHDVLIDGIPFNLKLTECASADNIFDKVAIHYTITGQVLTKKNMNFDAWWSGLVTTAKKAARDPSTEYHFIVVNKSTGAALVKSIIDIHSYKKNPCNILQISWANEFANAGYEVAVADYREKVRELLGTIQASLLQRRASEDEFCKADLRVF